MKIKTLELISFGKFKNRKIHLADRLNLIYGLNEAGKTTIQHFIEGMFFGFLKPYRKIKIYSELYEQYKPLKDSRYFGAMTYEDENGREIRLERNFLKSDESLRIYDGLTGEDISDSYPYDPVSRQPLPLGDTINAAFYNNTVNLKERGQFSREVMLKEINDRLISKGGDADEEVSIYRVLTRLNNKRDEIGTLKQKKSNYGEAVTHLHQLEKEKEVNEKNRVLVNGHLLEIKQMEEKLGVLNETYMQLAPIYKVDDDEKRNQLIQRIDSLNEENDDLQRQIKNLEKYRNLSDKEWSELNFLRQSSENLKERIDQREKEINLADQELLREGQKERVMMNSVGIFSKEEVQKDSDAWQKAEKMVQDPKKTFFAPFAKKRPLEENEESDLSSENRLQKIKVYALAIGLILIGFSLLLVGFIKGYDVLTFMHLLLLGFVAWFSLLTGVVLLVLDHKFPDLLYQSKPAAEKPNSEDLKVTAISNHFERDLEKQESEQSYTSLKEDLILKYAIKNNKNVEEHLKTLLQCFSDLDQIRIRLQFIQEKKEKAQKEKASLEEEQKQLNQKLEETLTFRDLETMEDYNSALQKKDRLRRLENRLDYNQRLYKELEEMLAQRRTTSSNDSREASIKRVELRDEMEELSKKVGELTYKNDRLLKETRPTQELEDEIETYRALVHEYSENYKAYTMAIEVLKECATVEKDKLLPALGEEIGKIFSEICGEKAVVKVDQHLNIRVVRNQYASYVPIESLSSGTVEQLYFAMRFGVQSMTHEKLNLPFILDDAFVQYDSHRKEMALRFLSEVSGQKQVIIFTCNDSEKQILDRLQLPYYGLVL
ncbi:MAG: AAA family ATPase [Eubacteriaceae bacterium]|jgi:uncharacterized protein YhaN|nr:AAA family ATPase [Eubacteriaceae bacterium]